MREVAGVLESTQRSSAFRSMRALHRKSFSIAREDVEGEEAPIITMEKEMVELRATVRIETDDLTIETAFLFTEEPIDEARTENGERSEVRTVPRDELASTIID